MKEKTKKYELLKDDFIERSGVKLYRIRACKDFGGVRKGDLGGYIEKEENLSHEGTCWVYDNAKVWGNAEIRDDAKIFGSTEIYDSAVVQHNAWADGARVTIRGKAYIEDNASIYGSAEIFGSALIRGNASVGDNARIYGHAVVKDRVRIGGNAEIFDFAQIYDSAVVGGYAKIYNRAKIGGNAKICGDAEVYGNAQLKYGLLTQDIKKDLIQYIACSLNVYPINGKYILYKKVNKEAPGVYTSLYDPYFVYRDGKYAEAKDPDPDFMKSCGGGIHVSTPFYWDQGSTLIAVEVDVADVITCMEGKLRCKRVKVLGEV